MKYHFTLPFLFFISLSFASAQDTGRSIEQQIDQTTDNIEKFVDGLVNQIENHVDQLVDDRAQRIEYNSEFEDQDQEKDKTKLPSDAITFNGNTEISADDTIQGDLVVKNGNLTVYGTVTGDVLVVNGDIDLKQTSKIFGNVRTMNGSISKADGAYVEGFTEQSSNSYVKTSKRKNTYRAKYSYSFKPYFWNTENVIDDNFLFRYNRVEGFFVGFGSEKKFYWDGSKIISGYGSFGYGFASNKWRLQLGLDRQFAVSDEILYEIGGEVHSLTDTKDEWIMNLGENSLASLFFREDFRDYYQREGFSIHTARYSKNAGVSSMIDIRFLNDRYESMNASANWAIFGNSAFRSNPIVNHGSIKSIIISGGFSTVEKYRYHSEGWNIFTRGEYGGKSFGGDYDFNQVIIDVRRFQPLSDDDQLNVRIRAGALEGTQIVQKSFELGGANTIPAYGFKEFSGNRLLLANVEYRMNGDFIDELFFWPNSFSLILFGDAGGVANVNSKSQVFEGFSSVTSSQIKSDFGFAIGWHDGDARLGFAWRTDKQAPPAIFFRLNRAF